MSITRPFSWDEAARWRQKQREAGRSVVFTNGVFDILHAGHAELLRRCSEEGDSLIVGLNSDASARRIKGPKRPIVPEVDRASLLLALRVVDAVVLFDEETPAELISKLLPDVLIKGGDYTPQAVVGRETVEAAGGRLVLLPLMEGRSSSGIVETVLERYSGNLPEKQDD